MKSENKKQSYMTGAAILSLSTMIVKVIGMFYKIPLKRLIGDAGYGYFTTAYDIYTVLLVISTTGLPVAMSRLISEAHTLGNGKQMHKIYRTALCAYLTIGFLGTALMMLFPSQLSVWISETDAAKYSIFALGPSVLFICFASACRGLFQGQQNMAPTGISQVIEATGKLVLGLSFAWIVISATSSEALASGATIAGISIGSAASATFLFFRYRKNKKKFLALGGKAESTRYTLKRLLAIAVPITIGAAGLQIINLIDTTTVMHRMYAAAEVDQSTGIMAKMLAISAANPPLSGGTYDLVENGANIAKGIYNFAQTIFNLPTAFIPCITAAIIPAITSHITNRDSKNVRMVQDSSMRLMGLIAMPCAVGLGVLAEPIMVLLGGYSGDKLEIASMLLAILAPSVLVASVSSMTTAIMQAHDHMVAPVINTLIGGLLKVFVNYILVGNPALAIVGAPIGTLICHSVIMLLNLFCMRHLLKEDAPHLIPSVWKSALAALMMGVVTYFSYRSIQSFISSTALCCIAALAVAVVVYVIGVLIFKPITKDDCSFLPKGDKIAKILRIH